MLVFQVGSHFNQEVVKTHAILQTATSVFPREKRAARKSYEITQGRKERIVVICPKPSRSSKALKAVMLI
jgi:hypothetical protein